VPSKRMRLLKTSAGTRSYPKTTAQMLRLSAIFAA
jgi:hypothetical protein